MLENANWNGKELVATDVAKDYFFEKEIRKASGRKELKCTDSECKNPILRYCHGEKREAFFAHLNNDSCDYAIFDRENTSIMRNIRRLLSEHFIKQGFNVKTEVKLLKKHYTHLLFEFKDNSNLAIELGTQQLSANKLDRLVDEYDILNIPLRWIVIGEVGKIIEENKTFFIKRYVLNESINRSLIVIEDENNIAQYVVDTKKYLFQGRQIESENYPDIYCEFAKIDDLVIKNGELEIKGFNERYQIWLEKKGRAFQKKIYKLKQEQIVVEEQLQKTSDANQPKQLNNSLSDSCMKINGKIKNIDNFIKSKSYEELKQEIFTTIEEPNVQARDSKGNRWLKCENCGDIAMEEKFNLYGGINRVNLGTCNKCIDLERIKNQKKSES